MLTQTFSHIKGISENFEKQLAEHGIKEWDDFFINLSQLAHLPKAKLEKIKNELPISKQALETRNLNYFKNTLKPKEHWRLFPLGKVAYVDIETTGLSKGYDYITLIGIYDGQTSHMYVHGENLHAAHSKLQEFDIVVTFNGKQFDIPFIEHCFSHSYNFVHLDLRYLLKEMGLAGGLKSIEYQLGIERDADLQGVDGFEAVRLWHKYKRGHQESLQKLLKYNEQDIVNLKTLLQHYLKYKNRMLN